MTVLLGLIAVLVIVYQLRRIRGELARLQAEVATLERRLERYRRSQDAGAGTATERAVPAMPAASAAVDERGESAGTERVAPEPFESWPVAAAAGGAAAAAGGGQVEVAAPARHEPAAVNIGSGEGAGADLETRLGTTWTLRIGLGAITIAAGLFARAIVPSLSPGLKVVMSYAGALALVAVGRVFEERLARFGRPVMAGGLAIGFFVSFASYFVPAMRAVPLTASLVWMAAGVMAILALAARWRSEPTAGLAIVLGHLSAFVAAGDADSYSLVVILFLSMTAVVLLWRHDWLPLSLVAVVAAYGSHLLWGIADRSVAPPERAMLLSLLFLSSYYAVFLTADLLWWRRRQREAGAAADPVRVALGRSLGPVNVVLYASTAAFLYFAAGEPGSLTRYLFAVGAAQFAVTGAYHRLRNPDWAVYPALGTVFVTIGFASALDALSLDVVLASEALVLLVAAQWTGLRVFHLLAQVVLLASFAHYLTVPPGPSTLPLFAGGVLIALAYFTQATLEERWFAGGGWRAGAAPAGLAGLVATRFDAAFGRLAPYLAHAHAAGGALILVREAERFLSAGGAATLLLGAAVALAAAAVLRRSVPLLIGYGITHAGVTVAALGAPPDWEWRLLATAAASLLLPLGLLFGGHRALRGAPLVGAALIGHVTAAAALLMVPRATVAAGDVTFYLATIAVVALVYFYADRARSIYAGARADVAAAARSFAALAGVLALGVIVDATAELVGPALTAQRGVWLTSWAALLVTAAAWRRDVGFYLAGYLLLVAGAFNGWLGAASAAIGSIVPIAAVPFALALFQDHGGAGRLPGGAARLATSGIAYVLAIAVLWAFFLARIDEPWYVLVVAALAVVIHLANARAWHSTGRDIAILLMFLALFIELSSALDPLTAGTLALLVCSLLVATAALMLERLVARAAPLPELFPARYTATALVAAAAGLALVALDSSAWRGGAFATVGYSIAGAALMMLGFLARSARHRRIALAVFALTLARAIVVDARGLTDAGRTLAFLVLGLSLVAVAWLYSRFAARIREWL